MPATRPQYFPRSRPDIFPFAVIGILLFVLCGGLIAPSLSAWHVFLVLFAGAGIFAGCAGDPGYKYPGTPEGRYTLTVTATAVNSPGTATQSATITLIVK